MLVSTSKYREAMRTAEAYATAFTKLRAEWDRLVTRLNAKGGEDFIKNAVLRPSPQFTAEELTSLIWLCHPDKHGNSAMANSVTAKLLALKRELSPQPGKEA